MEKNNQWTSTISWFEVKAIALIIWMGLRQSADGLQSKVWGFLKQEFCSDGNRVSSLWPVLETSDMPAPTILWASSLK